MVQAARRGAQNLQEGSVDSATSKKIELKLGYTILPGPEIAPGWAAAQDVRSPCQGHGAVGG